LQCAIGSHTLQRKDKGISIVPQGPQLISGLLGRQPAGDVGPNAAAGCHYFRLPGLRLPSQLESITVLDDALNYYQLENLRIINTTLQNWQHGHTPRPTQPFILSGSINE